MLEIDTILSVREVRACPPSAWMVVDSVTDMRGRLTVRETGKIDINFAFPGFIFSVNINLLGFYLKTILFPEGQQKAHLK